MHFFGPENSSKAREGLFFHGALIIAHDGLQLKFWDLSSTDSVGHVKVHWQCLLEHWLVQNYLRMSFGFVVCFGCLGWFWLFGWLYFGWFVCLFFLLGHVNNSRNSNRVKVEKGIYLIAQQFSTCRVCLWDDEFVWTLPSLIFSNEAAAQCGERKVHRVETRCVDMLWKFVVG